MHHRASMACVLVLVLAAAVTDGCSAPDKGVSEGGGSAIESGAGGGAPNTTSSAEAGQGAGGEGGFDPVAGSGGGEAGGVPINPCGSACGPDELCDADHTGFDDDCDGQVDEGCPCSAGQAHSCFKGDPSFHDVPGCFDGTQKCSENGLWGPCIGGVHADAATPCFLNDQLGCHAVSAAPFQEVNLKDGTGTFSADAAPGSESWKVSCPEGVSPCPGVGGSSPADDFKPLQSGEYTVQYTKGLVGGGKASCSYPLIVGAPGLRVELSWEHSAKDGGVDLDLHLHKPNDTSAWGFIDGVPGDCAWSNCTFGNFWPEPVGEAPAWFAPPPAAPPTPVSWWLDPTLAKNTCYFAPQGVGLDWQEAGKGCHNPRLDLDNIACKYKVTDPNDPEFCAPENINIDFPPIGEWTRIGVHYYSNNDLDYDVHPRVKVFCDGQLAADLGPAGYHAPEAPVTFTPQDGAGPGTSNRFWLAADVIFRKDVCHSGCVVAPLHADANLKTPYLTTDTVAVKSFGPPYPPAP